MGRHPFLGKVIMFKTIVELVQFGPAAPGSSQRAADRLREHGQRGSVPSGWSGSCRQKIDALAKNRQGTSEKKFNACIMYKISSSLSTKAWLTQGVLNMSEI
jgi:hypothetical protein